MEVNQDQPSYLINGEFGLKISPLDRGFAYGDGVFRTLYVKEGKPLLWNNHYSKLQDDSIRIGLNCPSSDVLIGEIDRLFNKNSGVCKIVLTRGESKRGYAIPQSNIISTRVVIKSELPVYPEVYLNEGVKIFVCSLRLSTQPKLAGIKHLNRLENVLARSENSNTDYYDGLMLDQDGYVAECTAANIFMRIGKTLLTPDLSLCGVSGVIRSVIISHAENLDYQVIQDRISLEKLLQAEEVVITNSLYGAFQVVEIDGIPLQAHDLAHKIRALIQELK